MPNTTDALSRYREKRDFERTSEPAGATEVEQGWSFCVQQHAASRLHYDFRLELDGVLKSWAVPKGPSLVPGEKRMAVPTEDHPVEYGTFEGVIPEGEYGGGTVLLWDHGTWEPIGDPRAAIAKGKLEFLLHGDKLKGKFRLIRLKGGDAWLLMKSRDEHATADGEIVDASPRSVTSHRAIDEIAAEEGATAKQLARAKAVAGSGPPVSPARARSPSRKRGKKPPTTAPSDAALPEFVEPQLATLVDEAPEGDNWVHEIKLDGYRLQCRKDGDAITLASRNAIDWTARVPDLVEAAQQLDCERAIIDGELCWVDPDGRTVFGKLGDALGQRHSPHLAYFAFDLLFVDDKDLRSLPLVQRKRELSRICRGAPLPIRFSEHVSGRGGEFFGAACELAVEGIVSKRADSPYQSGRGRDWLKVKCLQRQEFVIVGFTPPTHARDRFGSLVLGVHDDGELVYAGRVGTGFARDDRQTIFRRLEPLVQRECPLRTQPKAPGLTRVQWVAPKLVGEVAFTEWTSDGRLRHPSFQGLREDKPATAVRRERAEAPVAPATGGKGSRPAGVTITNPEKVLYPDAGITKLALAQYYAAIADAMLPHLRDRPLMLRRCPEGVGKQCFYQKHASAGMPSGIVTFEIAEDDGARAVYLAVHDATGVVGALQMGALELHVWGSRRDDLEHPDRMVFDLDPDPSVAFTDVTEAAVELRDALQRDGLTSFVMSTGGKGLHVVVPLDRDADFDAVKAWSRAFAEDRVRAAPQRYVATMTKSKRTGKIFIDYLRNGRGATAIAPFSTRARPGAPVAVPLAWAELGDLEHPPDFSITEVPTRVASGDDPWSGYFDVHQSLPARARPRARRRTH
ncbi:MAG TPA: DNA ligase D [Nannocystaceae bacterium]|nr:DNA ligase D [Nannocystaceae bacterium]